MDKQGGKSRHHALDTVMPGYDEGHLIDHLTDSDSWEAIDHDAASSADFSKIHYSDAESLNQDSRHTTINPHQSQDGPHPDGNHQDTASHILHSPAYPKSSASVFQPISRHYETNPSPPKALPAHQTPPCEAPPPASRNPQKYIPPQKRSHPLTHSNLRTHNLSAHEDDLSLFAAQNSRIQKSMRMTAPLVPYHHRTVTSDIEWEVDLNPGVYPVQTRLTVNLSTTLPALHRSILEALGLLYSRDDPTLLERTGYVKRLCMRWGEPKLLSNCVDDANIEHVLGFLGERNGQRKYLEVYLEWYR